ncbi:MAG: hypothetical protein L6Q94_22130 [Calditrichia bacterium]|nr:hypothetical protein [Calditrichia bacterium]
MNRPACRNKGIFPSRSLPGFWLNLEWLWADPLPDSLRTLAEIDPALAEKLRRALES